MFCLVKIVNAVNNDPTAICHNFLFESNNKNNANQTNQTEDHGLDSIIDTTALGGIDTESDLEDVDNYIVGLTPPDINLDVKFTQ